LVFIAEEEDGYIMGFSVNFLGLRVPIVGENAFLSVSEMVKFCVKE